MSRFLPCLGFLALTGLPLRGELSIEAGGASTPPPTPAPQSEYVRLHKEALQCLNRADYSRANTLLLQALAQDIPSAEKKEALLEIGRLQEEHLDNPAKAITVYEQYLSLFPRDAEEPDLNLRLGRIYRQLGSSETAQNKFYEVLYAALRVKNATETKGTALRAQIEIAHTHFLSGNYEQAGRLYTRLKRLELPDSDRREVYFRAAYVQFLSKEYAGALASGREFLSRYPEGSQAAEMQYLIVKCLEELKQDHEALNETLKLLRSGALYGREHPDVWAYWQQKTGNDIGNALYEQGEIAQALTVYQTLAEISNKPEWRWPAVYQIGLCFERLRYPKRAIQAYRYILDHSAAEKADDEPGPGAPPLEPNLVTLREMAQWRIDHLAWKLETEDKLVRLLGESARPEAPQFALAERPLKDPDPQPDLSVDETAEPPSEPSGM